MSSVFHISKSLRFLLYGANVYSEKLYDALSGAGYEVAALFDRRHEDLKGQYPVPVYGLSSHPFGERNKEDYCVVIMLQNAMQHEAVAVEFLRQGFHKILYVPMRSRLDEETALRLRFQYNMLLEDQFQLLRDIPLIDEDMFQPEIDERHSIVRDEGAFKIVWCPTEILYTNPPGRCKEAAVRLYANAPLFSYFPYLDLFEYLEGRREGGRQYLREYGVNSCKYQHSLTDVGVVLQRKQLLEIYKDALNQGMDFFISSAPLAEWNAQSGVFNLLEGQHRALFLAMREFRYIPIRVSQSDYEKWNCPHEDKELQARLKTGSERPHILHPKYHKINEGSDRNDLLLLEQIQSYMGGAMEPGRELLEGKTVLDLSGTWGYYARSALRMRARRAAVYVPEGKELAGEIGALEGFPGVELLERWDGEAAYHTLFVLGALADAGEKELWIARCARACREECFVTVRDAGELELWKMRFPEARSLRKLFDRGRTVELYALRK